MRDRAEGPPRRAAAPSRGEVLRGIAADLEAAGLESPVLEAERLVSHALGISRADLLVSGAESLDPRAATAVAEVVARRLDHEPLQHIEGTAAFRQLILVSDRRALIPRPETEQLVDRMADWLGDRAPVERVLDIGTGSGAIALSLLTEGLATSVVALDTSERALTQADENAARSGVERSCLELRLCPADVWSALDPGERFDLIVSNPPYVEAAELARLPHEIRRFEPRAALAAGVDGLDVIRVLVGRAGAHLAPGGALFLEIGAGQGGAVRALLEDTGLFEGISVDADLLKRDRFVTARRKETPYSGG